LFILKAAEQLKASCIGPVGHIVSLTWGILLDM
jgi:hypothetical protein